jgi:hypothetical protein
MKKEIKSVNLVDKARHFLSGDKEPKTDEQSWNNLAHAKLEEAKKRGLPSRFVHLKEGAGVYFSIEEKNDKILIFKNIVFGLKEDVGGLTRQAIILEKGKEPQYAFEVEELRDLDSYWMLGKREEELDAIGFTFSYLKKAELFDSRKSNRRWKGLMPDVKGAIEALPYPIED